MGLGGWGLGIEGLGIGSLGSRVWGWGLRFRVWASGFGFWVLGFGFWVLGFGFWVLRFGVEAVGFGVLVRVYRVDHHHELAKRDAGPLWVEQVARLARFVYLLARPAASAWATAIKKNSIVALCHTHTSLTIPTIFRLFLTEGVHRVGLQKSIPQQIRQLILHTY